MSIETPDTAPFKAVYYREYGLHEVDLPGKPTYIASAPRWEEMEQLLRFQLPPEGDVVTNDYATSSVSIEEAPVDIDEAEERIKAVRYMSLRSDATIHLGSPHRARDGKVYLGALSIHHGEIVGATDKNMLYPVEEKGGLTRANVATTTYLRPDGTAMAICSDLVGIGSFLSPEEKRRARRLFGLTAWAYTDKDHYDNSAQVAAAGGEDNFYRECLETVISQYVLPRLPHTHTVVIADEGRPDLPPYNATFVRQQP